MGHAGRLEVGRQARVEPAGVPDDQAGEQPAGIVRERLAGALQPRAEHPGGALRPGGLTGQDGWLAGGQHGGAQVAGARSHQLAGGGHVLTG
jgi:hypothetical protein